MSPRELPYCAKCGAAVEVRTPEGDNRPRRVCPSCQTIHYENPKVVVGSVVHDDEGRVLLCRRAIAPRIGFWTLPAGFLEIGESAEAGAAREAHEEALARIEIQALLSVYCLPYIGQVQLLYLARLAEPSFAPGPESQEVRLYRQEDIPWDDLAFSTVDWALKYAASLGMHDGPIAPGFLPEQRTKANPGKTSAQP